MKILITTTIEGPSHNDVEQTRKAMVNALVQVKDRMNNGSDIRVSSCNADDVNQIYSLMGKIKWWTLGHQMQERKKPVRADRRERSWFDKIMWGFDE